MLFPLTVSAQNWEYAIRNQVEIITLFLQDLDESFGFLSEAEQTDYVNRYRENLYMHQSFCYSFADRFPELADQAMDLALATRGMILNSSIDMRQTILSGGDTSAVRLLDEWTENKEKIAREYALPPDKRIRGLAALEKRNNLMEKDLYRMARSMRTTGDLLSVRWTDIRSALGEQETAVEYTNFRYYDGNRWTDSVIYVAIILRKDMEHPQLIRIGTEKELQQLTGTVLNKSVESGMDELYGWPELDEDVAVYMGSHLLETFWKPLEEWIPEGDTVFYTATGMMHQLNLDVIPIGSGRRLLDRNTFITCSSLSVVTQTPYGADNIHNIIAFGGMQYDLSEQEWNQATASFPQPGSFPGLSGSLKGSSTWTFLPGTFQEIQAISKLESAVVHVVAYSGAEAVEEQIKALGPQNPPDILHIATHGFFIPPDHGEELDVMDRSGLLFSGANAAWSGKPAHGHEDGILTSREAANLFLPHTRLVVLSACETGLGEASGYEGVYGLQRAFKAAGADYLLMTLWTVPDVQTAYFMQYFYQSIADGNGIETAFQTARTLVRKRYTNPYYWAGFVLLH